MDISIPRIWQRVGERSWLEETEAKNLARHVKGEFLLVLHWPVSASYLDLLVWKGRPVPGNEENRFCNDNAKVIRLLEDQGIPSERIPAALPRNRSRCLAAMVQPNDILTLEFRVKTDDEEFLKEARASGVGGMTKEIEVLAVVPNGERTAPRVEVAALHVHLEPAEPMRKYDGYVALDLGNTNSTLVCLHAHDVGHAANVAMVNLGISQDATPIPSAVRLTSFNPPEDNLDQFESAECLYGRDAETGSAGWLVLGAKRILAEADPNARHEVWLEGQRHSVNKTLPAELFLCELFRAFHRQKLEVPRQLAITHPTTFSTREIEQLKSAVVQGWRRSLGATIRTYDPKKIINPELPHLIIDEASAAAIYFLSHDFLDAAGGLDLLNYLYPEGLNLLVYDCGGGTTDIALVHVRVHRRDGRQGHRTSRLTIEVLGRTGHRTFGGDNITVAVFNALKARLASRLVGPRLPYPEVPAQAETLLQFFQTKRREIDAVVPTLFSRDNLGVADNRRRRETTEALWRWAERFKIDLGGKSPTKARHPQAMDKLVRYLQEHHRRHANETGVDPDRIEHAIQGVELCREEIDAQIRTPLEQSIEYANRMITAKLGAADSPGGEVHRIYVVGNASRYPLVRETIEKQLDVAFVSHRIAKVREEDLKNSVAKGAALALRLISQAQNMEIDFDRRLNCKLPFDVTFYDGTAGGHRSIFREHDDYDQLSEKPLPVPESREQEDDKKREVFLDRRWPGDDAPKRYLRFQFDHLIRGPLTVWYDTKDYCFRMRDEGSGGKNVNGEELEKGVYIAPVQSGEY